jgi:two-component system, chemotaxis family, protein-glutamate methylesterase/glutaminase
VLNEVHDGTLLRFRCRVGHAFAPETLYTEQRTALEGALWAALRPLEEQAALSRRMAVRARELGHSKSAIRHDERAHAAQTQARTVRDALRLGAPPKADAAD